MWCTCPSNSPRVPTDDEPDDALDAPLEPTTELARGILHAQVATSRGPALDVVVGHLKSKLITYPGNRFLPRDENERVRFAAYALFRRTLETASLRGRVNRLHDGRGADRAVVVCGDLNDVPEAATSQLVLGPGGSEIGTRGELEPDQGDPWRLWNPAPRIPADRRFSRIFRGRRELIHHILVSCALLERVQEVDALTDRPLPTVTEEPVRRRDAEDSDHAPCSLAWTSRRSVESWPPMTPNVGFWAVKASSSAPWGWVARGCPSPMEPGRRRPGNAPSPRALDLGVTFFDTARIYGPEANQRLVGRHRIPPRRRAARDKVRRLLPDRAMSITGRASRLGQNCG